MIAVRERRPRSADAGGGPPGPLPETALAALWAGQRFPADALRTVEGQPLQVVTPGRENAGPGPDFRDAALLFPSGALLRGDVELHVRASDFRRHGHHRDPAYDGLALHVVFHADDGPNTRTQSGRTVPVVALGAWVAQRAAELERLLSGPPQWSPPCTTAVARMGPDAVARVLAARGEERLRRRARRVGEGLSGRAPAEALYGLLAEALGYGGDAAGFRGVASAVPLAWLWEQASALPAGARRDVLDAALLGAAGLLGEGDALHPLWRRLGSPRAAVTLPARAGRPANRPERRLRGLARLVERHGGLELDRSLTAAARSGPRELVRALTVREREGTLIGPGRAVELAVNAALPVVLAVAEQAADDGLARSALDVYARLPGPGPYSALRPLTEALRDGSGRTVVSGALRQQGALAVLKEECRRGRCGACPLS